MRPALLFEVPGVIATKGSTKAYPYRRRDGRIGVSVTAASPRARSDQGRIAWAAQRAMQEQGLGMFRGPVCVVLDFYLPRPGSVTKTKRPLPSVKPDIDKLCRLVLDGLSLVVFPDDAAVCYLAARKAYADGEQPRIGIMVREEA